MATAEIFLAIVHNRDRLDWVDTAKGVCIILVVLLNAVSGYATAFGDAGWASPVVEFSAPFRMPDFFLLSGLFLARSIHGPFWDYVDRKVVHFAYFYLVWLVILTLAFEIDVWTSDPLRYLQMLAFALIEPYGGLWFVHMLLIFYAVSYALRRVPRLWVLAAATALQIAASTGALDGSFSVPYRFSAYFVFFYAGLAFGPDIIKWARRLKGRKPQMAVALVIWAILNAGLVYGGASHFAIISLLLGFAGAVAVAAFAILMTPLRAAAWLTHTGRHSIVVYLTYTLVLTALIKLAGKFQSPLDHGTMVMISVAICVGAPLLWHHVIKDRAPLSWLYERPGFARLHLNQTTHKQSEDKENEGNMSGGRP
jgi:uncharacterized membrane protein YcfT